MTNNDNITANDFHHTNKGRSQSIKVIGVGGGGNNAVSHMFRQGIKDVSFVQINTDRQVLEESNVPVKVLIGPGLGAGGDPEKAKKHAEESAEAIAELFDDQTDMAFITAGMGGGTGTGAGPVVARIAKERGVLTVGIVTIPFQFEGKRKITKALEGADEMAKNVDSLLVIHNERLTEIYQNLDIFNAFAKADDTLLTAAQSITDIITIRGVINRDFNDVAATLRNGGTAIISSGYGEGPNRVTAAITDALRSPLLKDTDIYASKKLLMVLYVSDNPAEHPFNMAETNELTSFIATLHQDVDIMWGLYSAPDLDDKVKITILASGFEVTVDTFPGDNKPLPVPQPMPTADDERINRIYRNVPLGQQGKVISPDDYETDSDDLSDVENIPAVQRKGAHIYTSSTGRTFGRKFGATPKEDKPASKNNDADDDKSIRFNDID